MLAYSLPDAQPHATTAHRQFTYVEPAQGGILLERGDTPRKYTVYAIDSAVRYACWRRDGVTETDEVASKTLVGASIARPVPVYL